jgi:hypothetical protein
VSRKEKLGTTVLIALTWAIMIMFGAIVAETVLLYPNIFRDPPDSLTMAREFLVAGAPNDLYPPLGLATVATGALAILLTWRERRVRWWLLPAGVVFLCCEFVFSALYFWPRNTIMFVDPIGTHSPDYLRAVAAEFDAAHWVRVIGNGVSAILVFVGFLEWSRRHTPATPTS